MIMQKILFTSAVAFALFACGGAATENKDNKTEEVKTEPAATTISDNPVYQEGLALVAEPKNLCLTCHKVDEKLTGPSYRDVANKYENTPENVKMLTEKVIKGGSGVWGDIAMVPAPGLKQEDAEKMVKYILLLRNK
jgi:cytochrome c